MMTKLSFQIILEIMTKSHVKPLKVNSVNKSKTLVIRKSIDRYIIPVLLESVHPLSFKTLLLLLQSHEDKLMLRLCYVQ